MSAINSQAGRGKNAAPSYNAVFGQSMDQNFSCSKEEARRCWTVAERLMVSLTFWSVKLFPIYKLSRYLPDIQVTNDDKFNVYAREHFIIDTDDDDATTVEDMYEFINKIMN